MNKKLVYSSLSSITLEQKQLSRANASTSGSKTGKPSKHACINNNNNKKM